MSKPGSSPDHSAGTELRDPPRHIAIIMDGNGRWAMSRGLPRALGHREGVEALRRAVDACQELGVEHLTVFSFSTENWNRPRAEIDALFDLLKRFVKRDLARLHDAGVCIRIVGSRTGLSQEIIDLVSHSMELTQNNKKLVLNIAFNYGGRAEIVDAVKHIVTKIQAGECTIDDVDEAMLSRTIWSAGSPDPDLVIRTSGEVRLSNFLLWSGAYAELAFIDLLWPDFNRECLEQAIEGYRRRDRRFGGVGA